MPSKYDDYWRSLSQRLSELLADAATLARSPVIDVSAVRQYGTRDSWAGTVVLAGDTIVKSSAAHSSSLGNVLSELGITGRHPGISFRISISPQGHLQVAALPQGISSHTQRETDHSRGQPSIKMSVGGTRSNPRDLYLTGRARVVRMLITSLLRPSMLSLAPLQDRQFIWRPRVLSLRRLACMPCSASIKNSSTCCAVRLKEQSCRA